MNKDLVNYLENIKKPWGILFYKVVWEQLAWVKDMDILDFGSGFSITANELAKSNNVVAIEPNEEMVNMRECTNTYKQIVGDVEKLKEISDNSMDVIICHNVFEYIKDREEIIKEFTRILRTGGYISLVKHNHVGRIMQKVVFENNVDEALHLLEGGDIEVMSFGKVNYYHNEDILKYTNNITPYKTYGVRTFWALQQNNKIKEEQSWQDKMFEIEMKVSDIEEYKNISFFNHVLLKKS